jgi:CxxC motif-containing protein
MKTLICIVCPKGCHLRVDDADVPVRAMKVSGNGCDRGAVYAEKEITNPTRVVTSTVCISGAAFVRLPVKTDRDIPKKSIFEAMRLLDGLTVKAPVKAGDIIVPDVLGTGANFVATRTLPAR